MSAEGIPCVLFSAPFSFLGIFLSPNLSRKLTRHRITGNWRLCTAFRWPVERKFRDFVS
jgi:hypothetical protein